MVHYYFSFAEALQFALHKQTVVHTEDYDCQCKGSFSWSRIFYIEKVNNTSQQKVMKKMLPFLIKDHHLPPVHENILGLW
jgi:hypothetical protein